MWISLGSELELDSKRETSTFAMLWTSRRGNVRQGFDSSQNRSFPEHGILRSQVQSKAIRNIDGEPLGLRVFSWR